MSNLGQMSQENKYDLGDQPRKSLGAGVAREKALKELERKRGLDLSVSKEKSLWGDRQLRGGDTEETRVGFVEKCWLLSLCCHYLSQPWSLEAL